MIPEHDAVAFQFDVPLAQLKPGTYVCQVNVIDDAGGSFMFPRLALRVEAPAVAARWRRAAAATRALGLRDEVGLFVGAVAAVGVAAVASAEVVGGGEDQVGAFHVEVFGA